MMTQKRRDINNMTKNGGQSNRLSHKDVEKSSNDYFDLLIQIYQVKKDENEEEDEELQTGLRNRLDEYSYLISEVENRYCELY